MEIDVEKLQALVNDAVADGIKNRVSNAIQYDRNISDMVASAIKSREHETKSILLSAIDSCIKDEAFVEELKAMCRQSLAKQLVNKFGGELEKQVNALKSDPTTRSRIAFALDEIVKSKLEAVKQET